MKKKLVTLLIFIFSFSVTSAFAMTGSYQMGDADSQGVSVYSTAGQVQKDSTNITYINTTDGDVLQKAWLKGYLAQGATWGFYYRDSNNVKHYGQLSSTLSTSTYYDLTFLGSITNVGIWIDNSNANGASYLYPSEIDTLDGAQLLYSSSTPTTPDAGSGSSSTPAPTPPPSCNCSCPPPPSANDIGNAVVNALDMDANSSNKTISPPSLGQPTPNTHSMAPASYTPKSFTTRTVSPAPALPALPDLLSGVSSLNVIKPIDSVKSSDSPKTIDTPKTVRSTTPRTTTARSSTPSPVRSVTPSKTPSSALTPSVTVQPDQPLTP